MAEQGSTICKKLPSEALQTHGHRQVSWLGLIRTPNLPTTFVAVVTLGFVLLTVAGAAEDFHLIPY